MLALKSDWVWDSWYVFDGHYHHAFYLKAPKSLLDADKRHRNVSVGHSRSVDLINWQVLEDALAPSQYPAFDSWTTWTGSVVRDEEGLWWLFYTGTSREDSGDEQRIGAAFSDDLLTWRKFGTQALVEIDPVRYETLNYELWHDQAWRDPWVYRANGRWQMLITARVNIGKKFERGTAAVATSEDLTNWDVIAPITINNPGFGQLEVLQIEESEFGEVLIWCCGPGELSPGMRAKYPSGGMFSVVRASNSEPFDLSRSYWFPSENLYAARLVKHADKYYFLGFENGPAENFPGYICDPIEVRITAKGISPVEL